MIPKMCFLFHLKLLNTYRYAVWPFIKKEQNGLNILTRNLNKMYKQNCISPLVWSPELHIKTLLHKIILKILFSQKPLLKKPSLTFLCSLY